MCLAVYLGSSCPVPEVEWDKDAPAFYVEAVEESASVRERFSVPHVYYAGSHEGCGCGFSKDGEVGEDLEKCLGNYAALGQTVRKAMSQGAKVELFACWEGDQTRKPESFLSITPAMLESRAFEFKQLELVRMEQSDVYSSPASDSMPAA
ncbi:hypothetical protein [Aquipseudomonas guryensis]|jgi:hypothetical protein|uniref:Uncharacterized protein n=1 Tax=Aquipseudomonas guryensis TaxID=2759165 RepID=A0A7W4DF81_9GAMM|nr:hypothetical protein [Pseudomonas guryensis]MBB1521376.1 hypothetical protein [Pseudomonas guryensis]